MTNILRLLLATLFLIPVSASSAQAGLPPAQVYVVKGSDINMVSRDSKVPVSIQNNYGRAIRVRVHAHSVDPAVTVKNYVSLTIPAHSRKDALLPIEVISSGKFKLKVWVTTFTDIRISNNTNLTITANPDVELFVLVGFGLLIAVLVGLGGYRMFRRSKTGAST
jgi:hypothetical protein